MQRRFSFTRRSFPALGILVLALASPACRVNEARQACARDRECPALEVCAPDGRCLSLDDAVLLPSPPANVCHVTGGVDVGCHGADICVYGSCVLTSTTPPSTDGGTPADSGLSSPGGCGVATGTNTPPLFGGLSEALADGPDAVLLRWFPAADETAPEAMRYRVFMAEAPAALDLADPVAEIFGGTSHRVTGLHENVAYNFLVRSADASGVEDCNEHVMSVTLEPPPTCVDFPRHVLPIFQTNCVRCHSGANPPQGLSLTSYAGVMAGGRTGNEVVACQPGSSLLYQKISQATPPVGVRMPFDGPPYLGQAQIDAIGRWISEGARQSCVTPNPCNDQQPPTFGGLTSARALDATRAELCWASGADDATPAAELVYDLWAAATPGAEIFTQLPRQTSAPGATCAIADGLSPGEQACFVARARDAAGNRDANTVERCLTLPSVPPGCVDYATMIQPIFNRNCTRCHSGASPPQWLRLDSYESLLAGSVRRNEVTACTPATSLLLQKISASPPIGKRMPFDGPPYLTPSQIGLLSQWISDGAKKSCGAASPCSDRTAPAFSGVTSVTAVNSTSLRVCWAAATDAMTPAASLRYDLYESSTPGGEVFSQPPQATATGETCAVRSVAPGTQLCFVVRARDLYENRDGNTVERCATTPAETCAVDFAKIQPIFAARCGHCHSGDLAPRDLRLNSYAGVIAGGVMRNEVVACDEPASLLLQKLAGAVCGRRMPFDGPPYLAPSERSLLSAWVRSGARERCDAPSPCTDTIAPTFAGLTGAQAIDASTVELTWALATDNTAGTGALSYDVYEALTPGSFRLTEVASHTAPAGSTSIRVKVPPYQQLCFLVRARDLRSLHDANTVTRCVTPPAACVDYASLIDPIFQTRCVQCHSGANPPKGLRWDTYGHTMTNSGEVSACDAQGSKLLEQVDRCRMPRDTSADMCSTVACLPASSTLLFEAWIAEGAQQTCTTGICR